MPKPFGHPRDRAMPEENVLSACMPEAIQGNRRGVHPVTNDQDTEWPVAPDPEQPPAGEYTISFFKSRKVGRFGRDNIELEFKIADPGQWIGKTVPMYFPLPSNGPVGLGSKYYEAWCLAKGGKPKRDDRMTPQVFHGYWKARLGSTKKKATSDGKLREFRGNEIGRTIVLELIERVAGSGNSSTKKRGI